MTADSFPCFLPGCAIDLIEQNEQGLIIAAPARSSPRLAARNLPETLTLGSTFPPVLVVGFESSVPYFLPIVLQMDKVELMDNAGKSHTISA